MENKFAEALKRFTSYMRRTMHPEGYVCIGCGKELKEQYHAKSICPDCAAELNYRTGNRCEKCGNYIAKGIICKNCLENPPFYDHAYALFDYAGLARRLVIGYKDGDKPFLAKYIADYLIEYALAMEIKADLLTFVPSMEKTVARRGFDHCAKLAELFSKGTDIPAIVPLARLKHSRDQTKLNYEERHQAVQGAFALIPSFDKDKLTNKKILIIDDVLTTGATASSCARILKEAGAKEVDILTFAR